MTQKEQVLREDRRMAVVGIAAGSLAAGLGYFVLWRDGPSQLVIAGVTGALTAFFLSRRYRTLTEKIDLEQSKS